MEQKGFFKWIWRINAIGILLLTVVFLTACSIKTMTPNLFTTGESMVVTYNSQGCFHHSSNVLVFQENNVTIYKTRNQWNQKIAKTKMGTLLLTEKDKEGLNKLFSYYDKKLHNGCTTVDEIEIKRYKRGQFLSSKNITDASCGLKEDVLSLPQLIRRVENKDKVEK